MAQVGDGNEFGYLLLSRLKQDCEYYLGFGQRNKSRLWALDEAEQIKKMKDLFAELPDKPDWITLSDIEKYEAEMIGPVGAALAEGKPAKTPGMGM